MKNKKTLRLKYRLEPVGETGLEFQIYYMDNKFRCTNRDLRAYTSDLFRYSFLSKFTGIIIESSKKVGIRRDSEGQIYVCLIGAVDHDINDIEEINFFSSKERDNIMKRINVALKEWSIIWFYRGY